MSTRSSNATAGSEPRNASRFFKRDPRTFRSASPDTQATCAANCPSRLLPLTINVSGSRQLVHCRADWSAWELIHSARMPIATLQLTVSGSNFSLTPLPAQVQSRCTGDSSCGGRASHRLLVRSPASATLFCDEHVLDWAAQNGYHVTTGARSNDSAA